MKVRSSVSYKYLPQASVMPTYELSQFDHLIPYAKLQKTRFSSKLHVGILVKGQKIIAVATNKPGTRTRGSGYGKDMVHAEVNVVKTIGDISKLRGASLIVLRYKGGINYWGYSKPCSKCTVFLEKCLRTYGLQCVYYS